MSDAFWQYFFGFLGLAFLAYMQYRTKASVERAGKNAVTAANNASDKVDAVRVNLEENPPATTQQLSVVAVDLADVKKNTNGLVAHLIKDARDEGHAAGVQSEKDKAPPGPHG